jgi:hypothetical protein
MKRKEENKNASKEEAKRGGKMSKEQRRHE